MNASELLELAAVVSVEGPVLVEGPGAISASSLEQYWTASQCRFQRWADVFGGLPTDPSQPGLAVNWPVWRMIFVPGDDTMAALDPDDPENWPRNLFVWRSNLLGSSGKGHEYFLKHLLATYFAGCTLDDLRGSENRNRIAREILDTFNKQLWPDSKPLIHEVLLGDLKVQ